MFSNPGPRLANCPAARCPLPLSGWSACVSSLQGPLALRGGACWPILRRPRGSGSALTRGSSPAVLFPVLVDAPSPFGGPLIPEGLPPLGDSCREWVLCSEPWAPAGEGAHVTASFSRSPALPPGLDPCRAWRRAILQLRFPAALCTGFVTCDSSPGL